VDVGSTCGGDLAGTTCTIRKGGMLSNVATTAMLLFLQYTYKYLKILHILQNIRDRKKERKFWV